MNAVEPQSNNTTPLQNYWTEYRGWLQSKLPMYAELLNPPATAKQLKALWDKLPTEPSEELNMLYTMNNGDSLSTSDSHSGSFMGFEFLSIDRLLQEYALWMDVRPSSGYRGSSFPEGHIKIQYTNPHWIPLFIDSSGNCIGIDGDPDAKGRKGQIINFGRDEDEKFVLAPSLEVFLECIIGEVHSGACDKAIVEEDRDEYSYGLRPQSHLIDDLKRMLMNAA